MNHHVHVHIMLCGGGLAKDGQYNEGRCIDCQSKGIPLERGSAVLDTYHIAGVFKTVHLRRLKRLLNGNQLDWPEPQPKVLPQRQIGSRANDHSQLQSHRNNSFGLPSTLALQGRATV